MASMDGANAGVPPESAMKARPTRPTVFAKRHPGDRRSAKLYASAPTRHRLAKNSRPNAFPSEGYAYDYSRNRDYRFVERAYGSNWDRADGHYGQRGGWFAGLD
jgi:hypothetical protein